MQEGLLVNSDKGGTHIQEVREAWHEGVGDNNGDAAGDDRGVEPLGARRVTARNDAKEGLSEHALQGYASPTYLLEIVAQLVADTEILEAEGLASTTAEPACCCAHMRAGATSIQLAHHLGADVRRTHTVEHATWTVAKEIVDTDSASKAREVRAHLPRRGDVLR